MKSPTRLLVFLVALLVLVLALSACDTGGDETETTSPTTSIIPVTLSRGLTELANDVFKCCQSLTAVRIPEGVTRIGEGALYATGLTTLTIPDGVTDIGAEAFYRCVSLTAVTIGDGVSTIGRAAFAHCTSLATVTIPDGVSGIGAEVFWNCTSLTAVTFTDTSTWYMTSSAEDAASMTGGTLVDVTDPADNVLYLRDTYLDRYWYKQ